MRTPTLNFSLTRSGQQTQPKRSGAPFKSPFEETALKTDASPKELRKSARAQLFDNIISATLKNPKNPYSHLPHDLKKDMFTAIHEVLMNSHYFSDK